MSSTSKDAVTLRAKRSKKPSDGKMRRNVEIFVLSAPAILLFVCFVILPIVLVLITASISGRATDFPPRPANSLVSRTTSQRLRIPRSRRRFCIPSRS